MEDDALTAVVALVVAVFALFIALAQVMQQYYGTGHLIRICDSVVFGPMPGQGRRVWEPSQFRFRVLYSMPRISLRCHLYPDRGIVVTSHSTATTQLPDIFRPKRTERNRAFLNKLHRWWNRKRSLAGEAPWVSFCRAVQFSCESDLVYELVDEDADRHPTDIPVVAMQVSIREVIVMAYMAGMACTAANFSSMSLSMAGTCGSLSTSQHPFLGALIHFTPRSKHAFHGIRVLDGKIHEIWVWRIWGTVSVAGTPYTSGRRAAVRRLEHPWVPPERNWNTDELSTSREIRVPESTRHNSEARVQTTAESSSSFTRSQLGQTTLMPGVTSQIPRPINHLASVATTEDVLRGNHDGEWGFENEDENRAKDVPRSRWIYSHSPPDRTDVHVEQFSRTLFRFQATVTDEEEEEAHSAKHSPMPTNTHEAARATIETPETSPIIEKSSEKASGGVEPAIVESVELEHVAREAQERRRLRQSEHSEDENIYSRLVKDHKIYPDSEPPPDRLMIGWHNGEELSLTPWQEEVVKREREREQRNRARADRAAERRNRDNRAMDKVGWFWVSQMDVIQGIWASPWAWEFHGPTCHGAVQVVLQALVGLTNNHFIMYCDHAKRRDTNLDAENQWRDTESDTEWRNYTEWGIIEGKSTFPAYAINARNGVVVNGKFLRIKVPAFAEKIPKIQLSTSYEHQTNRIMSNDPWESIKKTEEVMAIDSWLSICGRRREIITGRANLIARMPSLVEFLMGEFAGDFADLNLTVIDGGFQKIQDVVNNVMDTLGDQNLSEAEQLYTLVAMLRATKVVQCIFGGADTLITQDFIRADGQVHLA